MRAVRVFGILSVAIACGDPPAPPPEPVPAPRAEPAPAPACKNGTTTCRGDDVVICENGASSRTISTCRGGCKQGACVDTCGANAVELIYVVDGDHNTLLSFDPQRLPGDPFKRIGEIACPGSPRPNSMAVDRTGIAWINTADGGLYQVSLLDAHCFGQAAAPIDAPSKRFGMGFVTDGPKATTEQLYVVEYGGSAVGTIDTSAFPTRWVPRGNLAAPREQPPELTGTSEGRLYGYFPTRSRGYVQELDRKGNAIGRRWMLPAGQGSIGAWAFAFWGDVFYVFVTFEGTNEVHAIHRKTGKHELAVANSPYHVVGAGVSTCAPLLERPL